MPVIWEKNIRKYDSQSILWDQLLTWRDWNANQRWKFVENQWISTVTKPILHTVNNPHINERTTIELLLRNNDSKNELLLKNSPNYWSTEIWEWKITVVPKMDLKVEIRRNPEINEEITITFVSESTLHTFESKSLSSCSNDPFLLEIKQSSYIEIKVFALQYILVYFWKEFV